MQLINAHMSILIQFSLRKACSILHKPTVLLNYFWGVCVMKGYSFKNGQV